jgi:hypothetical protein
MIPRPREDFIYKENGKMMPNLSKSRKRSTPTVDTIKIPYLDIVHDVQTIVY